MSEDRTSRLLQHMETIYIRESVESLKRHRHVWVLNPNDYALLQQRLHSRHDLRGLRGVPGDMRFMGLDVEMGNDPSDPYIGMKETIFVGAQDTSGKYPARLLPVTHAVEFSTKKQQPWQVRLIADGQERLDMLQVDSKDCIGVGKTLSEAAENAFEKRESSEFQEFDLGDMKVIQERLSLLIDEMFGPGNVRFLLDGTDQSETLTIVLATTQKSAKAHNALAKTRVSIQMHIREPRKTISERIRDALNFRDERLNP